jgi:hypothetical protein
MPITISAIVIGEGPNQTVDDYATCMTGKVAG